MHLNMPMRSTRVLKSIHVTWMDFKTRVERMSMFKKNLIQRATPAPYVDNIWSIAQLGRLWGDLVRKRSVCIVHAERCVRSLMLVGCCFGPPRSTVSRAYDGAHSRRQTHQVPNGKLPPEEANTGSVLWGPTYTGGPPETAEVIYRR